MLRRAVRTARGRVALLVLAVAFVMLTTAAILHYVFDQFDDYGEALWSAAVHLVDPGALVEDDDTPERAMGLFQAVAGLVLLIGLLFELVSETVNRSIERLGRYDPPVHARDHLLIIGGTELLTEAAGALALASEVGGKLPRIVVLAPEGERASRQRLRDSLRSQAGDAKLDLVFGDTADDSGFELGAAAGAATILVLPSSSGLVIAESADVQVMQSGLALKEHLEDHGAGPQVRMLFRRGHNVDAVWDFFPPHWDAVVGDRTVGAILRTSLTGLQSEEIDSLVDPFGHGDKGLLRGTVDAARAASRPLRLTVVGCGINAPALLEDLAQVGADRFELTMLSTREAFENYLGSEDRTALPLRLHEVGPADPEALRPLLKESAPDVVLVTPSPTTWDQRDSDAEATLALLHVLRIVGPETPVLAELFLPDSVERLPRDPRLLPVSVLQAVSAALALSIFNPERAEALGRTLQADVIED